MVILPPLLRPPVPLRVPMSRRSGFFDDRLLVSATVCPRRPGDVGLYWRTGM